MVDAAPYIREAQFEAYRDLENMGWACAYDQQVLVQHMDAKIGQILKKLDVRRSDHIQSFSQLNESKQEEDEYNDQ